MAGPKLDEAGRAVTWAGGYIRYDARDRATYYIRQQRGGVRYDLSTRAHDERSAHDHLRRFDSDPAAYAAWLKGETEADPGPAPIYLDKALRDEFLAWSAKPKTEGGKENTPQWQTYQRRELEWWAERLADEEGRALDLRQVKRETIFRILDGDPANGVPKAGGVRKKQAVLKSLFGWLRRHRRGERIGPTEDPLADVPNLPGGVAQANGIDKYVPTENLHAVIDDLVSRGSLYGHALVTQAGTGWHTRELLRFVSGGRVDPVPSYVHEPGVTAVLVGPKHKNGKEHITKVGRTVEQSARILLGEEPDADVPAIDGRARTYRGRGEARGSLSERHYVEAVHKTCKALGLPRFNPAWMRHTLATHAVQVGAAKAATAEYIGHAEGSRMVDIHYATKAIPPKVPTPMDDAPEPAASPAPPAAAPAATDDVMRALLEKVESLEREVKAAREARQPRKTKRRDHRPPMTPPPARSVEDACREFQERAAGVRERIAAIRARLRS